MNVLERLFNLLTLPNPFSNIREFVKSPFVKAPKGAFESPSKVRPPHMSKETESTTKILQTFTKKDSFHD